MVEDLLTVGAALVVAGAVVFAFMALGLLITVLFNLDGWEWHKEDDRGDL